MPTSQRLSLIFLCLSSAIWIAASGAVHLYPSFALTGIVIVWWGSTQFFSREPEFRTRLPHHTFLVNLIFALLIAACLISLLPLPMELVSWLSPKAADIYRENAEHLGLPPTTASLSVARASTAYALWILLGQCALFNASARSFYRHDTMKRLRRVVLISALVLILIELYQRVTGSRGFGMIGAASTWHIGSMINANHMATVLAAISVLALAATVLRRHSTPTLSTRITSLSLWLAASATMFIHQSRSAVVAWAVAHILLVCFMLTRRRRPSFRRILLAAAFFLPFVAGILWISHDAVEKTIQSIDSDIFLNDPDLDAINQVGAHPLVTRKFEKTDLYQSFVQLTADWSPAGPGRSAFADVYPTVQPLSYPKRFMHAENEPFELVMEFGPILGIFFLLLMLAAFLSCFRTLARYHAEHLTSAIFLGILIFLMQSFFDFGLRYWSCGYPAMLLLGALCGRCDWLCVRSHATESLPPPSRPAYVLRMIGTSLFAGTAVLSLSTLGLAKNGLTGRDIERLGANTAIIHENAHLFLLRETEKMPYTQALDDLLQAHAANALIPKLTAMAIIHAAPRTDDKHAAYALAKSWLETALRRAPRDSDAWLRLSKLMLALQDPVAAADAFSKSLTTDDRPVPSAVSEVAAFPRTSLDKLSLGPDDTWLLPMLADRLRKIYRFVEALSLADMSETLDDASSARRIRFETWLDMGFDEGAGQLVQTLPKPVTTFSDFRIATTWAIHQKAYDDLMHIMADAEETLGDIPEYWKERAYHTAFYSPKTDDFRARMAPLLVRLQYYARKIPAWRADAALVEAQTALRLGDMNHAAHAAKRVLKYRPRSKAAKAILQAAQTKTP